MKRVAVIEGGYSSEKEVSVKSAQTVFDNLDRTKFEPIKVLIDENEWTAYDNLGRYPINKNDFSFTKNGSKYNFDYTFIVIHGTPGEDGKLQGYLDMIGIPYNTSSAAITALTFQKFHCNQFLKNFGINVAEAVLIKGGDQPNLDEIIEKVALPCFVKPTDGGSSFGVTKVKAKKDLLPAINAAFDHGSEVIIEEFIEGRELTNGVYRDNEGIKALPITEIISENEFFDYEAKYNGQSNEVTPAEISDALTAKIKALTIHIYSTLGMKGIARVDYIIDNNNNPFVIEINSVPGMSKESIVPQMLEVEGIDLGELFGIF
ncbi:MAG: D-alanine--D-alanine ligase [Crocinitomicaceae bacterium]|nr:D-alanine--D-alanine ligase [Crocinitomicaceae bacterium]|tara:strand:+ start:1535 stop:2488 length:954 start_codon:yes stop_codon:yes gene_type:complete